MNQQKAVDSSSYKKDTLELLLSKYNAVKIEKEALKKKNAELENTVLKLKKEQFEITEKLAGLSSQMVRFWHGLETGDHAGLNKLREEIEVIPGVQERSDQLSKLFVVQLRQPGRANQVSTGQSRSNDSNGESREKSSQNSHAQSELRRSTPPSPISSDPSTANEAPTNKSAVQLLQEEIQSDSSDTESIDVRERDDQVDEAVMQEPDPVSDRDDVVMEPASESDKDDSEDSDKDSENQPAEEEDAGFNAFFEPLPVIEIESSDDDSSSDSSVIITGSTPAQIAIPTDYVITISSSSESDSDSDSSDIEILEDETSNIEATAPKSNLPAEILLPPIEDEENVPAEPANSLPSTSRANASSSSESRSAGNVPSNNNQANRSTSLSDITNSRTSSQNAENQPKPRTGGRSKKKRTASSPLSRPKKSRRKEQSVPEPAVLKLPSDFVNYSEEPISRPDYIIQHPIDYFPFPNIESEKEEDTSLLHMFTFSILRDVKEFEKEMTEVQFVQALFLSATINETRRLIEVPYGVLVPAERKYMEKLFKQKRPHLINPLTQEELKQVKYEKRQYTVFKVVETKNTIRAAVRPSHIDMDYFDVDEDVNGDPVYLSFL